MTKNRWTPDLRCTCGRTGVCEACVNAMDNPLLARLYAEENSPARVLEEYEALWDELKSNDDRMASIRDRMLQLWLLLPEESLRVLRNEGKGR